MENKVKQELSLLDQIKSYQPLKILFDKDISGYEKYVANVLNIVKSNPDLQRCNPDSILNCIHAAKTLGIQPDARKLCHLIPYAGNCKLEIDYKGLLYKMKELFTDFDFNISFVHAEDEFEFWSENGNDFYKHKTKDPFAKAEDAVGIFFYFTHMLGGQKYSSMERASKAEILKARGKAKTKNVWDEWFSEMGKKFIIKRACKRRAIENEEMAKLVNFDNEDYGPIKNVTPPKSQIDSSKLPDEKPVFVVQEEKQIIACESPSSPPTNKEWKDKLELYCKIRQELIDAEEKEQVDVISNSYREAFSTLSKEQQKDLSNIKKTRLELITT